MSQPNPANSSFTPELIRSMSALGGIALAPERAEILAPQAEQQLALMRALEAIPVGDAQPAGALRLAHETSHS
ncbi:MAG: hypothetical protein ACRDHN_10885 [Thermomicrobiales bacterium]